MSHTPGPWEMGELVDHDQDGAIFVDGYQVAGPAGCYVDAEADARLIAAAPDLLEVVEVVLERHELPERFPACLCRICNLSRAAIAKAKGE